MSGVTWKLDEELRAMLVCPRCHGDLGDVEAGLACPPCGVIWPVVENVPMLVEECALRVDAASR